MTTTAYLYDLAFQLRSDRRSVLQALRQTLRYKGAQPQPSTAPTDTLQLDFAQRHAPINVPAAAERVGEGRTGLQIWQTDSAMYLEQGDAVVDVRPAQGIARGALTNHLLASTDQRRNPLFYLISHSVVILLRYRGWFGLHAAALAQDDRGVLLAASSDSGKSTAALNLVRAGWQHLSDDTVLLRSNDEAIRAFSFRRDFCLDPDATALFPELEGHAWPPSLSDATKWRVDMGAIYPGQFRPSCRPQVLILPQIIDAPASRLEPAEPLETIAELTYQSALFLTPQRPVANQHLDLIRDLVDQCACYRLHAGRDLIDDSKRIHHLLAPLVAEPTATA